MPGPPEALRAAFRLWLTQPVQALLSMLGVAVGVGGMFLVIAVGRGAESDVRAAMAQLGSGSVFLVPAAETSAAEPVLTAHLVAAIERVMPADLDVISPQRHTQRTATSSAGQALDVRVVGVTPSHAKLLGREVARGRDIADLDQLLGERVCVVGAGLARALYPRGDALGQHLRLGDSWHRIVGVLPDEGLILGNPGTDSGARHSEAVEVPLTSPVFEASMPYSSVGLRFHDEAALALGLPLLERVIETSGGRDRVALQLPIAALRSQHSVQRTVALLLLAASLITLCVAGVGIMNTMLLNVTARRAEIGLRRAVGATRMNVLRQFVLEATVLTVSGGLLGSAIGLLCTFALALTTSWTLSTDGVALLGALTCAVLMGALFGGYPAWRAAGLKPMETLRGPV